MEFVHDRTHGELTRRVNIIDGPVMAHPSSSTGKKIRVRNVSATFILDRNSGEWVVNSWSRAHMSGVVLRKDGSEGKETWDGSAAYGWDKLPEYAWLRKLIDAMRPEGVPALPFRLAGLENDDLERA